MNVELGLCVDHTQKLLEVSEYFDMSPSEYFTLAATMFLDQDHAKMVAQIQDEIENMEIPEHA